MSQAKVYLAGPIQHAADHGKGWRSRLKDGEISSPANVEFVDPMDKYNTHEDESAEWTDEDIVVDDLKLIGDCDAILVHWLEVPTCGTPMEVFFTSWFPAISQAVQGLGEECVKRSGNGKITKELFIREAFEEADVPYWMYNTMMAMNEDIPVVVQTSVPPEEISPWLSSHTDVQVETFEEALRWIENNINDGDLDPVDGIEAEYELVSV